ncbi:7210_t:CDS:2 [Entrophospora sp. SA101]|nr:7210_t:CDS:2 [Entrophospora sp. SA101]CAJ0909676.1 19798_t:CDS:2 [Entrophospora sp. SA101]
MTSFPSTPITPSSPYPTAPINTTSSNYFNNNNANNNEPAKINHKSMPAAKTNPLIQIQPHRQNTFPYYNNQNQEEYNVANRKREAAVKEIVTTEKTYVEGLRKLVSVFLVPLREDYQKSMSRNVLLTVNKNPMATLEDITLLFGNIEQLLALHEQLLKNLEERYYNWNPKQLISGLPFNSFISLPIQRIPRYRLLLEQLFNYTVESHPDYKSLKKCVEQISTIADEVNEKIRDAENQQRVLEIQTQVEGLPTNIIDPARRFIYKGDLFKVMPKKPSSSTKPSYVSTKDVRVHFLFNDLLLFCIEFQGKLLYKGDINLKYAMVRALEEDAADQPFCFQVIVKQNDADRRHTVRATSYDEQVKWIERINAAIYSLNNGILSNSYNSDSQRLMPIK